MGGGLTCDPAVENGPGGRGSECDPAVENGPGGSKVGILAVFWSF